MDVNDRLDLDSLRLPQNYTELVGVKKVLSTVPLRKPHKHEFFRVHPSWTFEASVLRMLGETRRFVRRGSAPVTPRCGRHCSDVVRCHHHQTGHVPALSGSSAGGRWATG
jgi:hypothetical protein